MKLLLDTHVFLWFVVDDSRLLSTWRESIRDPGNEVFVSVVSFWEIAVKYKLGKLPLPQPPQTYLPEQRRKHRMSSIALDESSVNRLSSLPDVHRDPFDRMLICQAIQHELTIVTND